LLNPSARGPARLTYAGIYLHIEGVGDDAVFKALADPTRRALLDRLRERNGQTLGELCGPLAMARQSATQHLGVLEAANLVSTVRRGRGVTSRCARSLPGRSPISAASTARRARSHRAAARCGAAPRPRAAARAVPHP
jgi:DNA-binding transcriptional ArsR family regulator